MSAEVKPTVDEKKRARRTSRREFLCLGAGLAVGAAVTYALTPQAPKETFSGKGATKVKITVLKTPSIKDFGAAAAAGITPTYSGSCPVFAEGQEFIVDAQRPEINTVNPDGAFGEVGGRFCKYAWEAIFPSAWVYYEAGAGGRWYNNDRVIIWTCPDGVRPVSLKLEWI